MLVCRCIHISTYAHVHVYPFQVIRPEVMIWSIEYVDKLVYKNCETYFRSCCFNIMIKVRLMTIHLVWFCIELTTMQ